MDYKIKKAVLYKKTVDPLGETVLLVVLMELRHKVFEEAHSSILAGHFGSRKTQKKINSLFYWPQSGQDITRWCKACPTCQQHNMGVKYRSPLKPLPIIEQPWQRLAVDIVGPLPKSTGGYKYLLTAMDFASRYPEAIPLCRVDAKTVSDVMLQIFSRFGVPDEILSDNGTAFTAKYTQTLMAALGVKSIMTSPYHPQTNGMLE